MHRTEEQLKDFYVDLFMAGFSQAETDQCIKECNKSQKRRYDYAHKKAIIMDRERDLK